MTLSSERKTSGINQRAHVRPYKATNPFRRLKLGSSGKIDVNIKRGWGIQSYRKSTIAKGLPY